MMADSALYGSAAAADYTASLYSTMLGSMGVLVVGIFVVYFLLIFLLGLMFYFFTGSKPGAGIVNSFSKVAVRFYSQLWMFVSMLLIACGLYMVLKAILEAMFSGFAYGSKLTTLSSRTSSSYSIQTADLIIGVVLIVVSIVVFAIHWGLQYIVEGKKSSNAFVAKFFLMLGLVTTGLIVFGSLFTLVLHLVAYAQNQTGTPGADLALFLGTFPVWLVYVLRGVWMSRTEK